jgi:hypothetical protein
MEIVKPQLHAIAPQITAHEDPQKHIYGENLEVIEEPILPMEVKKKQTIHTIVEAEVDLAAKELPAPRDLIPL